MIRINKNTLDAELVRGDTGTFSFYLIDKDTKQNILQDDDVIEFLLRKIVSKEIIINKRITEFPNGIVTIPLSPTETANLEADNYIYKLTLLRADGNVDTLNPNRPYSNFSVKEGGKLNG